MTRDDTTTTTDRQGEPQPGKPDGARPRGPLRRFLPLAIVAAGLVGLYLAGVGDYLTLDRLADRRDWMKDFVAGHQPLAMGLYLGLYALLVALSFPAASVLTVFGGFLFGWFVGGTLTAFGATAGATAIFLIARSALGDVLRRRAGPFAVRLADGFEKDAFSYLLILRLAPVFPFFVVNIVPAFFNVGLRTYLLATFFGILPATFAYAWLGQGLDSILLAADQAGRDVSLSELATPEITVAFMALALVAAIPLVLRGIRGRIA